MKNAFRLSLVIALLAVTTAIAQVGTSSKTLPRTADGKPNLQGIWMVKNKAAADLLQDKGIVEGGTIPYLAAAATQQKKNFTDRKKEDPLEKCYLPGTPRIMYMEYPFQIFQTPEHVAMTFTWSQVYRLIYTNGKKGPVGIDGWMGDARGHWEGDTLVVDVKNFNDRTWFDAAGNHHSDALSLVERYTLRDADTIQYEVTVTDPKSFSKPWKITMPLMRQKNMARIMEYQCQADKEEANGAFERDPRTWYPKQP